MLFMMDLSMLSDIERQRIHQKIFAWYKQNGRHSLPWRHTTDLYHIALAEIMLQQTNVAKVIQRYDDFLARYPTVTDLAQASQADVLTAWRGLGYNRRALNLYRMAQVVVAQYRAVFPGDVARLLALPGIGPYTARSICVFGHNEDVAAIDVNVSRFVRRLHGYTSWESAHNERHMCENLLPQGRSRDWHNAVMDFSSDICTKRQPKCAECPLRDICRSFPDPQDYVFTKKKEPGRMEDGRRVPRRIFRGRIVEVLRDESLCADMIGARIKKDWNADEDGPWLEDILDVLCREKIITMHNNIWRLR